MLIKIISCLKKYCYRPSWSQIEYFDENWKIRIQAMILLFEDESSVLDIGCGKMWLKEFLPKHVTYYGCDYRSRSPDTIVVDLNKKEFPDINIDLCFISGCLEYVENIDWFISQLRSSTNSVIISYCTRDQNSDLNTRKCNGWVNHLYSDELVMIFKSYGFVLVAESTAVAGNHIYKFKITDSL